MGMPLKPVPVKFCETCGVELKRKIFGKTLEDRAQFMKRKFCSLTCAGYRKRNLTKHGYSWRARKYLKDACEACGATNMLQAHHVDQNNSNNSGENIQTLCRFCHDFWHSTQKRLGKDIAGRMPSLFS